ncbi:MAG TPA: NADH-quinone oxidoreductase subunit J [Usitatibacter sp.]|jgi:NADH-quinone oxidoreductase subunit J|nr:NADH-quinone oxidoreductase subunit J [Usitatibacter sp.]
MDFSLLLFYFFGAVLIASSLLVITVRNPVHAALFLVLAFVSASGLWLLAYAEFLAITLVLVYVGAVMVLFLFVVMMLDINLERLREGFWRNLPLAGAVGVLMVIEMAGLFWRAAAGGTVPNAPPPDYSNSKALGAVLYTDYVYPFELAAVVLLVAIVAAIALTLRHRKETKYQDPATQLSVRAKDRLKIVKLPSETQVPVEPPQGSAP